MDLTTIVIHVIFSYLATVSFERLWLDRNFGLDDI